MRSKLCVCVVPKQHKATEEKIVSNREGNNNNKNVKIQCNFFFTSQFVSFCCSPFIRIHVTVFFFVRRFNIQFQAHKTQNAAEKRCCTSKSFTTEYVCTFSHDRLENRSDYEYFHFNGILISTLIRRFVLFVFCVCVFVYSECLSSCNHCRILAALCSPLARIVYILNERGVSCFLIRSFRFFYTLRSFKILRLIQISHNFKM